MSLNFNNIKDANKRSLVSFVSKMNGQANRVSLRDHSYSSPAGSLSVSELNPTLAIANWTESAPGIAMTDVGNGIRVTRTTTASDSIQRPTTEQVTVVGESYSVKHGVVSYSNAQAYGKPIIISASGSTTGDYYNIASANITTSVSAVAFTAAETSVRAGTYDDANTLSFTHFDIIKTSMARCLLVDNGFNALTYSEQFDNAAWTKTRSTVSANPSPGHTAPDGSETADELVEDATASETHYIFQSYTRTSAAEFWTGSVYIKENTQQRIQIRVDDGTSANYGSAFFDANTGTITGAAAAAGTSTLAYASIHDASGGWYRCRISVRLPATTTATLIVLLCNGAANTVTYNGDGTSGIFVWGGQLQKGGQLGRYTETTTTATTGAGQTGKEVWLKGADASTSGQLLAGDQIEIGGQLLILDEDFDGDSSGVGLARVSPRIRTAPSDEDPAILYQPHGTFILANDGKWANAPGGFTSSSLIFVEDIT
jgi:hypothetical protein